MAFNIITKAISIPAIKEMTTMMRRVVNGKYMVVAPEDWRFAVNAWQSPILQSLMRQKQRLARLLFG